MIAILKDKKGFVKSMEVPYPKPYIVIGIVPALTIVDVHDAGLQEPTSLLKTIRFLYRKQLDEQVALYVEE